MPNKVFVAGHRGMVGQAIVKSAPAGIEILTSSIDLRCREKVYSYLEMTMPDVIILAAARVGGIAANSMFQSEFLLQNLEIQNSVIGAAQELEIPKLLFLGSSCVYPRLALQPINEASLLTGPLEPTNEGYAIAKIAGIKMVQAIYNEKNLNYFSLMPTNLYGENDNFDELTSHVPAALMRKFHEAKISGLSDVTVWGTGKARREFMHVEDLSNACWFMLDQNVGGDLINVGTGIEIEIAELAQLMAKVVGYRGEISFDSSKPDGAPQKLLDLSKIHSFGWSHAIELEVGLKKTYSWLINSLERGHVRGY